MASTNVYSIPLYTKGLLTAVGYREGCGYNAKIFWGGEQLASRPSLMDAALTAYIGTRLYSPKFHSWMTHEIRVQILEELEKMSLLVFPTEIHSTNDGLMKNLKTGMKWFLDNKLVIKVDEDVADPVKTIELIKEEFMKSERLSIHIRLLTEFKTNPSEDMFSVSLGEDTPKKTLHMRVTEDNLPIDLFGSQWIGKAVDSFNSFRRISAQGEPYQVHGTLEETSILKKLAPSDIGSYRSTAINKLNATFDFATNTGDFSLNVGGNTISLNSDSVTVSAPKINLGNPGVGYVREREQGLSEFGKMIRKVGLNSTVELDKNIPIYFVQAYAEQPYIDPDIKFPMPMMRFIKECLGWDYLKEDLGTWVHSTDIDKLFKNNLYAYSIIALAHEFKNKSVVLVPGKDGSSREVKSFYFEPSADKEPSSHHMVNSVYLP